MEEQRKVVTPNELRAAYAREWRKKNPEAAARHIKNYWERKAKKINKEAELSQK